MDTLRSESLMPCNPKMDKHEDDCIYENLVRKLVEEFGCSVPYLPQMGKEPICEPNGLERNISKKYVSMVKTQLRELCPKPCSAFEIYSGMPFFSKTGSELSQLKMYLRTSTKINKIHPDYTAREMVADIGGYTGLLLGVSLVRVNWAIEQLFLLLTV